MCSYTLAKPGGSNSFLNGFLVANTESGMETWTADEKFSRYLVKYEPDISQLTFKQSKTFYRDHLTEEAKNVYAALKNGIAEHVEEIALPGTPDHEEIQLALIFVSYDCPELFWFKPSGSVIRENAVVFRPDYTMTREEASQETVVVNDFLDTMVSDITSSGKSSIDMRKEVLSAIADKTVYDASSEYGRQVVGIANDGHAYCAGYARTEILTLRKMGVPCVYIEGRAKPLDKEEEPHAWVLIVENGKIAVDDPTWYDSDASIYNSEWFDRSWQEFSATHFPKLASTSS